VIFLAWALVILIGSAFVGMIIAAIYSNRPAAEVREDWWRDAP